MQKATNFNDIAIVSIKGNDYRTHFWYMSKDDPISIINNSSLNKKTGSKMSGTTYYQRNRRVMLNRANKYYKNNKEVLREKAKNKYKKKIDKKKKNIRREYARNIYHNMSTEKKQRLKEYQKNYREAKKHLS